MKERFQVGNQSSSLGATRICRPTKQNIHNSLTMAESGGSCASISSVESRSCFVQTHEINMWQTPSCALMQGVRRDMHRDKGMVRNR